MSGDRKNTVSSLKRRLRTFSAVFLLFAAFAMQGCSTVNSEVAPQRSPKELYDSAMSEYLSNNYGEAERLLKALLENHPLHPLEVEAQLLIGDVAYANEKYDDASSYYTNFLALHPTHSRASYALFQKGMCHFQDVLTIDRDQTATKKALFAFEDLLASYPDSPYSAKAKDLKAFLKKRLADRELYVAEFYFKSKNYKGALARLRDLLKNYPETGLNDAALFYIGQSYFELGEEGLAKETFKTLLTNFPESSYAEDAKDRIGG